MAIDFDALASRLLADSRHLLESWLPNGRWSGREYLVGDITGQAGESLSINADTGVWADFSGGPRGGDLTSLYAAIHGLSQSDAARELGGNGVAAAPRNGGSPRALAQPPREIERPPADATLPIMVHPIHGRTSASWQYLDADGVILGFVARYDPAGGRKQYIPWTWHNGDGWVTRQWPAPRPLYGLAELAANPDAPVLLVEGEKAADAARQIVGRIYLVVTWPGGAAAHPKTDFAPLHGRRVLLWPDADCQTYPDNHAQAGQLKPYGEQPGPAAMAAIAAQLVSHCPDVKLIRVWDDSGPVLPDGWDAADALADGWDWARLKAWAAPRASVVRVAETVPVGPDHAPDPYEPPPSYPGTREAYGSPAAPAAEPWPEPVDIFESLAIPQLRREWVPEAIANYAFDQSDIIGCDVATIAAACIASCCGAIHNGIKVQPNEHNYSWLESSRLWVALVGDPSSKKSPAISRAISHLKKIDIELAKAAEITTQKYELAKRVHEAEVAKYAKNPTTGEPIPPEKPQIDRILVDDVTVEKLGAILECSDRGVLKLTDELSGWFGSMDAYSKAASGKDRGHWLESYNGGSRRIDRISRGSYIVPNWSCSMLGGIQPDVIQRIASVAADDGLLQRFMVIIGGHGRPGAKRRPDTAAQDRYRQTIDALASFRPAAGPIQMTQEAVEIHDQIVAFAYEMMDLGVLPRGLQTHMGKWEGLAPRLMLTFHLIERAASGERPDMPISEATAERVLWFMRDFLFGHSFAFYGDVLAESGITARAREIANLILARGGTEIKARDIVAYNRWYGRVAKGWEQEQVINRLIDAGWIRRKGTGADRFKGVPATLEINPAVDNFFRERVEREKNRRQKAAEIFNRTEL